MHNSLSFILLCSGRVSSAKRVPNMPWWVRGGRGLGVRLFGFSLQDLVSGTFPVSQGAKELKCGLSLFFWGPQLCQEKQE